jgi:Leucine-rich repeat (LRR) protein
MITVTYKDERKEKFTDFESVPDPENVVKVLIENSDLTSLQGISRFVNLLDLDCYKLDNLSTLEGIENCTKLTGIGIEYCKSLVSLKGLENHTSITDFMLCVTSVESVDELKNCTDMKELQCSGNKLKSIPEFIMDFKKIGHFEFNEGYIVSVPYKLHEFLMDREREIYMEYGAKLLKKAMHDGDDINTLFETINSYYRNRKQQRD